MTARSRAGRDGGLHLADRSFGPCRSAISAIGRPELGLDRADESRALAVLLVRAVREVEASAVHALR